MRWCGWRSCVVRWLAPLTGHPPDARPSQHRQPLASPMPVVVLYTRQGCHLCEDALEVLRKQGLAVTLVDIDRDPDLRARYDCCVPVVEIDGRERFRGRVNQVLLRRLLARAGSSATQPAPVSGGGPPPEQGQRDHG